MKKGVLSLTFLSTADQSIVLCMHRQGLPRRQEAEEGEKAAANHTGPSVFALGENWSATCRSLCSMYSFPPHHVL